MAKILPAAPPVCRHRWSSHPRAVPRTPAADDTVRTVQSFKTECDINHIMSRYRKTGVLPPGIGVGRYGDFSDCTDYLDAQMLLQVAEAQFKALPALVRERFKNSPANLLTWLQDPANLSEAQNLGLLHSEGPQGPAGPLPTPSGAPPTPPPVSTTGPTPS